MLSWVVEEELESGPCWEDSKRDRDLATMEFTFSWSDPGVTPLYPGVDPALMGAKSPCGEESRG